MAATQYPDGVNSIEIVTELLAIAPPTAAPLHTFIEFLDQGQIRRLEILHVERRALFQFVVGPASQDIVVLTGVVVDE